MSFAPVPLPGTHLAEVDCVDCGAVVLAAPAAADVARCSPCWEIEAGRLAAGHVAGQPPGCGESRI